ncbi:MAG: hypothetical protein WCY24_01750 [Lutispora sp.]|nr:hypothetical protein [Lutispora sp.]MDD4833646.1 hypothetical protein [Lutispora sp.]
MQQVETKQNTKKTKGKIKLQNLFLILAIILLTAVIVIGGILFFNIGGAKPVLLKQLSNLPLLGSIIKPISENKTPQQIELELLDSQRKDIDIRMKQLEEKQKELETKEKAVSNKEELLNTKEAEIDEKLDKLNSSLSSIMEQVEYLEKMESSKAMQILSNMESKNTVVQILRNMKKEKSSSILMLMDPLQAAQILEDIAQPENVHKTNN